MTVKAVYEGGVFRPKEPVDLAEHTEVEIEIRPADADPLTFVGFITDAPAGVALAQDHDEHLGG